MSLTTKLSVQIAGVDIKETCCVYVPVMNSDELAIPLVVQGR